MHAADAPETLARSRLPSSHLLEDRLRVLREIWDLLRVGMMIGIGDGMSHLEEVGGMMRLIREVTIIDEVCYPPTWRTPTSRAMLTSLACSQGCSRTAMANIQNLGATLPHHTL